MDVISWATSPASPAALLTERAISKVVADCSSMAAATTPWIASMRSITAAMRPMAALTLVASACMAPTVAMTWSVATSV